MSYLFKPGDLINANLEMLPRKNNRAQYSVKYGCCGRSELYPFPDPGLACMFSKINRLGAKFGDFQTLEHVLLKRAVPRENTVPQGFAATR